MGDHISVVPYTKLRLRQQLCKRFPQLISSTEPCCGIFTPPKISSNVGAPKIQKAIERDACATMDHSCGRQDVRCRLTTELDALCERDHSRMSFHPAVQSVTERRPHVHG